MIAGNPDPAFERFLYMIPTDVSFRCSLTSLWKLVRSIFEQLIDKMKEEKGVQYDIDLTAADLKDSGRAVQG